MERLQETKILQFRHDTLEEVRKDVNLDKQRINQAVDLLLNWIQKQTHFVKKDFSREYLEVTLITCKGLVERTKQRLDKLCTFRTLMPEFFIAGDLKKELSSCKKIGEVVILPKLTYEHRRVCLIKISIDVFDSHDVFMLYKYGVLVGEYLRRYDYVKGFELVMDYRDCNILNVVSSMNPTEFRKALTLLTEGYGMRIKTLHLVTPSKWIDALVGLFKQVLSPKIGSRIMVHKTLDSLYELVPKEIFPLDYGGEERPLNILSEQWTEILSSKETMDYFREMNNARTVESCRPAHHFNENYIGTPGSFRALSVD